TPHKFMPKLFGELRDRYLNREGGYTRVTRTEPKNTYDQAESSILEFVDGPKDSRFMMTAKTIARDRLLGRESTPLTLHNAKKVTQFRGQKDLDDMVERFVALQAGEAPAMADGEDHSKEAAEMADRESAKVKGLFGNTPAPESAKKMRDLKR
ncbi:hypothetical protein E4U43_007619, partial [Claviceps pusilla]